MSKFMDTFKRRVFQRKCPDAELNQRARTAIMQLASEGKDIEGVLVIFIKGGRIYVMEGGLHDDFEAQVMIQRAQYLINDQGLVTQ